MLLLPCKSYEDRNVTGTNTSVEESNEKLINLLLHYTERSQNTIFPVVMLQTWFDITLKLIFGNYKPAVTFSTYTDGSTIVWIQPQKVVKDIFNYIYHVTMPRIISLCIRICMILCVAKSRPMNLSIVHGITTNKWSKIGTTSVSVADTSFSVERLED